MSDRSVRHRPPERLVRRPPGFAGLLGATAGFCLSLTPSLLPRHWALQAVLSAIAMATGYGAGAVLGAVVRRVWPGTPPVPAWGWWATGGAGAGLAALFLYYGSTWQEQVRALVGAPPADWPLLSLLGLTVAVFAALLLVARSVRLLTRRLADALTRFSPRPVASVTAVGLVAALSYGLGPGVAFPGFVDLAERAAAQANQDTAEGLSRPDSGYVSGGPGSLVGWETLGAYGREFTATAVPEAELADFRGGPVMPPVRVYVGVDSAPTLAERVALAVRELERTGGLRREVVAVVVTTGTGWVDPAVRAALEYLHGGDTAVVGMQYSYLPSWISFMADRSAATAAARELIEAVGDRLARLPESQRPELVVYGESLGSHGIESAFGDLAGLLAATDGALLVGPPHSNPIWNAVRERGTPEAPPWRPAVTGAPVSFAAGAGELPVPAGDGGPEVVYLHHASDPVVWWSPELLYREPEWLDGQRGPDVSGRMRWLPVVTFWQVTVDLIRSTKAPPGHGHVYRESIADGWAALVPPPGWTGADTAALRDRLSTP